MKIAEIFLSIQGEARNAGRPTIFIRTAGCNLASSWGGCTYCDTKYARDFESGKGVSIYNIIDYIQIYSPYRLVEITGGNPGLQKESVRELVNELVELGYEVDIEENGSIDISYIPRHRNVRVVLDMKTPGSGMSDKMLFENLELLTRNDDLKFVITSIEDMDWAVDVLNRYTTKARVYFSPCFGKIDYKDIANYILENRLDVAFIRLHKHIWSSNKKGV